MANLPNIPYTSAYPRLPIRRTAPPVGTVSRPEPLRNRLAESVATIVFAVDYNDGSINVAFPTGNRVVAQAFQIPIAVVSVTLSTSLINAVPDAVLAVWVGRDVGAQAGLNGSNDVYVVHMVNQGLSHSMVSGVAYDEQIAPYFGSGQQMAIYISSSGTGFANNRAVAAVTVRYFPLT